MKFNETLGPAFWNRNISNNIEDFMTMEKVHDIDYYNFFSYRDKDNFVYSFRLASLYNLVSKGHNRNPYNRIEFDAELKQKISKRYRYNKILGKVGTEFEIHVPAPLTYHDKIVRIFNKLEDMGNYVLLSWYWNLERTDLGRFLYELYDIWHYRAELDEQARIAICPPSGMPFGRITSSFVQRVDSISLRMLQTLCQDVMSKLIFSARDQSNQSLGGLFILSALTLVSEEARNALPWLYASVQ